MDSVYTLSLVDRVSSKMRTITGTTDAAVNRFAEMQGKLKQTNSLTKDFGGSISSLRSRIDLLQAERDIISPNNLSTIRQYNTEIARMNRQLTQLSTTRGGLRDRLSGVAAAIPGLGGLMSGSMIAGAGTAMGVGSAFGYSENLAKVNVTAQLDPKGLSDLESQIASVSRANKSSVLSAPVAFEKIISQTNDVAMSLDVLNAAQKGAKAGFTDIDTVSSALAQTMSIMGKENMNASAVLDTLFAAKRVGAGNFADFARYIPGLTAGAKNLGVSFQDVAGVFAYMTGMGNSAEKSAVYIENAFSSLGKSNIQEGMKKFGVQIFDSEGKMRSLTNIAADLNGVLAGKSDLQKSSILEQIGLTDKEARTAFAVLTSNVSKLSSSIDATNNSLSETALALGFADNELQRAKDLWSTFQSFMMSMGKVAMPLLSVGVVALNGVVTALDWTLTSLIQGIKEGNPLVLTMVGLVGAWTVALSAAAIKTGVITLATQGWAAAQALVNTLMSANPIGLVVSGIALLIGGLVTAYQKWGAFRGAVYASWEAIKGFGVILKDYVIDRISGFLSGLGSLAKGLVSLFKGDFADAIGFAKEGAGKMLNLDAERSALSNAKALGGKMGEAYRRGVAETVKKEKADDNTLSSSAADGSVGSLGGSPVTAALASGMGGVGTLDLNNRKGSTIYGAIASRMRRIALPTMAAASLALSPQVAAAEGGGGAASQQYARSQGSKTITIEKIEIHVASLDGKGKDDIVRVVEDALKEVFDRD